MRCTSALKPVKSKLTRPRRKAMLGAMPLRLHNTLTGKKDTFTPTEAGHARVYVCGPTVYDFAHLGHARCYVIYDVLVRHLRATGTRVTYVRNITDVDDKIVNRAKERHQTPIDLATQFTQAFTEDMAALGNLVPDIEPKVTDNIPAIIALIQKLIERGHAYASEGDVYFSVPSFPNYGALSHRKLDDLQLGASERLQETEQRRKRHPADFALWKSCDASEWNWSSPWGPGRPGWHIECSAMSMLHLGETLDLHGGGLDLVFPHHENEIAQSEAATGVTFSRHWVHNGFVEVNKEKMSKSLGNFFVLRELLQRYEAEAVRYLMLSIHYRSPLNLDWTVDEQGQVTGFPQFEDAERRVEYLYGTMVRLGSLKAATESKGSSAPAEIANFASKLRDALDDDLNMPVALAQLAEFLKATNELCDAIEKKQRVFDATTAQNIQQGIEAIRNMLGIGQKNPQQVLLKIRNRRAHSRNISPEDVETKIKERSEARRNKNFSLADGIRDELARNGIILKDSASGTEWTIL